MEMVGMDLQPFLFLASQVLPYITLTIFSMGILSKILGWLDGSGFRGDLKSPAATPSTPLIVLKALILDVVFFRKVARRSLPLWLMTFPMHILFALILFGHTRSMGLWSASWFTFLAPEEVLTHWVPFIAGWILLLELILLTLRRILSTDARRISRADDFLLPLLLAGVMFAGNMMRVLPHGVEPYTLTIPYLFTMHLPYTPPLEWMTLHMLLIEALVMYLPFSKLIHILSGIISTIGYQMDKAALLLQGEGVAEGGGT
jgi:nitrate reductase gamma subunit